MRYEVTELDIMSVGKVVGIVYGAGGLVMWLFVPLFLLIPMDGGGEAFFAKGAMAFFFLLAPVFNAVVGFIMGLIAGLAYNILARTVGGLRLTLRQEA